MRLKKWRLQWREGNQVDLLRNGAEFFPALCAAIDAATVSVHLETYIFNLDRTGQLILARLASACGRGVKVRVVIDGFGSHLHELEIIEAVTSMGGQCRVYRPEPRGLLAYIPASKRLRRLHRKVSVIDGTVAFVGGINIVDDLVDVPDDGTGPRPRFDFAVRVQGSIVSDVVLTQRRLWLRLGWRRRDGWAEFYKRMTERYKHGRAGGDVARPGRASGRLAAVALRDNVRFRRTIEDGYLSAMAQAQEEIFIANAYFFPGRRLRQGLRHAVARGVRVRLLLQGRSEYTLQYRACRSMYYRLFDDGIEVYEYMASYLHAKVAVLDSYAIVGSANLDPFSLLLAREANIFVRDAEFADELAAALEAEIEKNCQYLTQASLSRRSYVDRFLDAAAYFLLRIAVALTGESSRY